MSDQVLTIVGLGTLALVYYVFLRVVRSAWLASRTPRTARLPGVSHLVIVEPESLHGRLFDLCDDLTLGRAAGCSVTIDDSHMSQVHARIIHRGGQFVVEDLGSVNGTYKNRDRVIAPTVIGNGDRLQMGDTILEVA
ncbi:MAG: FHA domain-containing protein [Acidimicrobiia bacterium]|nr:FHA domain-containing protein [Actinomycetota bacterium]MBL6924268.1 FHA domain-containing protein [Acidimicrobiia bacterium]MBL6926944.1 FHA domain-containing protein [Acidimicrobiia bacterium]